MPAPYSLPKYLQISEMLIRDIQAGHLLDGERLPPERDMARGHGISVGTLRKALADLEKKGLLARRHGSGNYVKAGVANDSVYAFFRLELAEGGGLPTATTLSIDLVSKPDDLPQFGETSRAHRIRRLRRLNDRPAALEEIWLDSACVSGLPKDELSESLYMFYRVKLGLKIDRVEDRVGTGAVPDWGRALLPGAGRTLGLVDRTSWDQSGQTVEMSRTWFDPAHVRFVSRMR